MCTALCLRLEATTATLAVGGHPLPLYLTTRGVTELGRHGPLLGAFPDVHWEDEVVSLDPGATLFAYTDGFTDARQESGERFGLRRLRQSLADLGARGAGEVAERLTRELEEFQAGTHTDDTAALVLRRLQSGVSSEPHPARQAVPTDMLTTAKSGS